MYLKRFYVEGLAQASYLIGSKGKAAVIDPKRDIKDYLEEAEAANVRIVAIFLTHLHADFASGHRELSVKTGATVYIAKSARAKHPHSPVEQSDVIPIGSLAITVLETPGHSLDSLCYLVREVDSTKAVFTGDTLFVGDVGRPDLRDSESNLRQLAGQLYDSLANLMKLRDPTFVYPSHGHGSLCGRTISSDPYSTIGRERYLNWAIAINDREAFVDKILADLPERPPYFAHEVKLNLEGAAPLRPYTQIKHLSYIELLNLSNQNISIIDTRPAAFFGQGHFPKSLNIGLSSPLFSTWVGYFVPFAQPIVLIVGEYNSLEKAHLELARIGFDNIVGYLLANEIGETAQITQLSVCDLKDAIQKDEGPVLVDVRTTAEWQDGNFDTALHIPLTHLPQMLKKLPRSKPIAVICGSGYRSSLASSYLQAQGFEHPQNVMGGMHAFRETPCEGFRPHDLVFRDDRPLAI